MLIKMEEKNIIAKKEVKFICFNLIIRLSEKNFVKVIINHTTGHIKNFQNLIDLKNRIYKRKYTIEIFYV
jgi:hypothetical protein